MIGIRKSFSKKLSLGILLLAVPIFILSLGVLFQHSRYLLRKEAMEHTNSVLNTTMQRLIRHVNAIETATETNSWLATEYLDPDSLLALSHRIVLFNANIDGCSISTEPDVFPQHGRYFSVYTIREGDSINTVIEEPYEYFDKEWYKQPKERGKASWVVYYDESDTLKLTLDGLLASYNKPLYSRPDSQLVAVISTDMSLLRLSKAISEERPYPNSYFIMLDEYGHYYINPDSTQLFHHSIFDDADPVEHADIIALGHEMTAGNKGNMRVEINGETCLVSYQSVPGTTWSLALVCPDSDILQGYYKLAKLLIPLLVIGLLMILLLSYHLAAHAIRPINQLLEKTQSIASGNYEVHIPQSPREDVVGRLQNSFAAMLRSLNFHLGSTRYMVDQTRHRNEELVEATRLAKESARQKTMFIQNVSHQVRTPLNIIMGFAQVIRDSSGQLPEEDAKSILSIMDHNKTTLDRMVLMLFDSSEYGIAQELNISKDEQASCNSMAQEAIALISSQFPHLSVRFVTELTDDFCIRTNRLYMVRTLREILYNSAKYSDGKNISLTIMKRDNMVRFICEDTGPGIPPEYYDYIFEPFTKLDDLSEGLGLGMALSKRHVQMLGGTFLFDTDYHEGCRIIIDMPA